MLVVLGGISGTGRKALAREVAERLGAHYYDIDAHRMTLYERHEGAIRERKQPVRTEELRLGMLKRVLDDFKLVSKMYPDTVVENNFHHAKPRGYFLAGAAEYFEPVVFVWVDVPDQEASGRFERMYERDATKVERAMRRRQRMKDRLEPFPPRTIVFVNDLPAAPAAERLCGLLRHSYPHI
jgi:hypothetical protein